MEVVEFENVDVLDETGLGLLCRVGTMQANVPPLLLQPRTTVRRRGDHGTLVIPRWLGIALGLVSPFPETRELHRRPARLASGGERSGGASAA